MNYVIRPMIPCPGILCGPECRGQHYCQGCGQEEQDCYCGEDCLSESEEE